MSGIIDGNTGLSVLVELAESVTHPLADARGSEREEDNCGLVRLGMSVCNPRAYARGSVQNKWRISGVGGERNPPTR